MTEFYINNQWVNINNTTINPAQVNGSTPGSEDKDPQLQNLLNSLYYCESANGFTFSNPPTQAELETFAQGINSLTAYFAQNGAPDPTANPNAYGIYNAINSIPVGLTESPADLCADLMGTDPMKAGAALAELQSPAGMYFTQTTFGSEAMNNWFHGPNHDHAGSPSNQEGNADIKADVTDLQSDISRYNTDLAAGKSVTRDLEYIAADMVSFSTDSVPTSGNEDGYLLTLTEFLGSSSNPNSFLSLATAVNNSPTTANLQALQTALKNANETGTSNGGDLTGVLNFVMWGEY